MCIEFSQPVDGAMQFLQIREQESSDIHGGDELRSIFIPLMRITE